MLINLFCIIICINIYNLYINKFNELGVWVLIMGGNWIFLIIVNLLKLYVYNIYIM